MNRLYLAFLRLLGILGFSSADPRTSPRGNAVFLYESPASIARAERIARAAAREVDAIAPARARVPRQRRPRPRCASGSCSCGVPRASPRGHPAAESPDTAAGTASSTDPGTGGWRTTGQDRPADET